MTPILHHHHTHPIKERLKSLILLLLTPFTNPQERNARLEEKHARHEGSVGELKEELARLQGQLRGAERGKAAAATMEARVAVQEVCFMFVCVWLLVCVFVGV